MMATMALIPAGASADADQFVHSRRDQWFLRGDHDVCAIVSMRSWMIERVHPQRLFHHRRLIRVARRLVVFGKRNASTTEADDEEGSSSQCVNASHPSSGSRKGERATRNPASSCLSMYSMAPLHQVLHDHVRARGHSRNRRLTSWMCSTRNSGRDRHPGSVSTMT